MNLEAILNVGTFMMKVSSSDMTPRVTSTLDITAIKACCFESQLCHYLAQCSGSAAQLHQASTFPCLWNSVGFQPNNSKYNMLMEEC